MDNVLRPYLYKFCFVYFDDIIVFSKSLEEHIQHLALVFQKLREANLKIQLDKTEFLHKEVAFLGHIVSREGVRPNPDKIRAVKEYPTPKQLRKLNNFSG